ncbi:hypothetical protein DEO48_13305 [Enterobacter sp. CGMCC 5087]|nr:hypothetical protein DEO48_13305 [Enterobacter sp. CGMCC 5087]
MFIDARLNPFRSRGKIKTGIQPDVRAARRRAGRTVWRKNFKYKGREAVDLNQTILRKYLFAAFF